MKKVKIAFWLIVFGFVALIIVQNKAFFGQPSRLTLNLGFFYYETPFLANWIFFVAFFLIGILITYFLSLFKQFKDAKTIKSLKAKEASLVEAVESLERQLSARQAAPEQTPKPVVEQPPTPTAAEP